MRRFTLSVVLLFSSVSPLVAQWAARATVDGPRRADGTLNLEALPPRTADGRIDFSGVWVGPGFCLGDRWTIEPNAGAAPADPQARLMNFNGEAIPWAVCFDIGSNIKGGAPLQPWAAGLRRQRMDDRLVDSPQAHCLPMGHVQLWLNQQPREIVQTPRQVVMLWEANQGVRRVFTDGRAAPDSDAQPWWYGYSTGTWDGDTFVVTTTHIRDGQWLDINGTPLTGQARIVERMRRPSFGTLDIAITIDDPGAFTRPFTVGVRQQLSPGGDLIEFICNENEQSSRHYVRR